jgi:hypothetical protein
LSSVLHVAIEVKADVGAIRASDASKFFTSIFASGVGEGFGAAALIVTPLFQTSFVPDVMQVNFFPPAFTVAPALVHLAPALTAAKDGADTQGEREKQCHQDSGTTHVYKVPTTKIEMNRKLV